jgi:hypothetical protein
MNTGMGITESTWMAKNSGLLPSCLNRDILKLPIKTPGQMPLHVRKGITHDSEENGKIFDIDTNV